MAGESTLISNLNYCQIVYVEGIYPFSVFCYEIPVYCKEFRLLRALRVPTVRFPRELVSSQRPRKNVSDPWG